MSTRPIDQPLMHPEALWSARCIAHYAAGLGLDGAAYIDQEDFPVGFRLSARAHLRWKAGEVMDYFKAPPNVVAACADHVLYRYFDKSGVLLYVGVSLSVLRRIHAHSHRSRWFSRAATITLERFATRAKALAAESRAIANESPRHNRV